MDQASGGEDPNKPSKKKSNEDESKNKKLVCIFKPVNDYVTTVLFLKSITELSCDSCSQDMQELHYNETSHLNIVQ